jgi:hypothetical protein
LAFDLPGHEWFRPRLDSPVAAERAEAARAAGEAPAFDLEPRLRQLLADDSPYTRRHGDRTVVGEVRFDALAGLQSLAAARGTAVEVPGGVVVRKAMDAGEAKARAAQALAESPGRRGQEVRAKAARDLVERVQPEAADHDAVLAYRMLQLLGLVDYRHEEIDAARGTTPLQEEVRASQLASPRPRPHLVVTEPGSPDRPLGYVYREPGGSRLVVDFAEGAAATRAEDEVRWALSIETKGLPKVRHEDGSPVRTPDGALVFDGVLDPATAPEEEILRSIGALVAPGFSGRVITA